jgi:hypothetical protein
MGVVRQSGVECNELRMTNYEIPMEGLEPVIRYSSI